MKRMPDSFCGSTWRTFHNSRFWENAAMASKRLKIVSSNVNTCEGSRIELQAVNPAISANKMVVSLKRSAIGFLEEVSWAASSGVALGERALI